MCEFMVNFLCTVRYGELECELRASATWEKKTLASRRVREFGLSSKPSLPSGFKLDEKLELEEPYSFAWPIEKYGTAHIPFPI